MAHWLPRSAARRESIDQQAMLASPKGGQVTYFNRKKRYAGLMPSEMKRLRESEEENARLKKIGADLMLDREMLQDVVNRKL